MTLSSPISKLIASLGRGGALGTVLLGGFGSALAATYYVATSGSDTNPGSEGAPFRTIRKAAGLAAPGDVVHVNPGVYAEVVDVTRAGTASQRITWFGHNSTTSGLNIRQPYNTFDGFYLDGATLANYGGAVYIYEAANYTWVFNCTIRNLTNMFGVQFAMPRSQVPANGQQSCIVSNCVLDNVRYINFVIFGNGHKICNNTISNTAGEGDAFRPWGANHVISDNLVSNLTGTGGGHADVIQVFGGDGGYCQNITFERNRIFGSSAQICQFEMDPAGGYIYRNGFLTNMVFRNNIFANLLYAANVDMDGTKWYNNLFYRCNTGNGGHVFALGGPKGSAWGTEIKNNVFYECGSGASTVGWYPTVGGVQGITNLSISADYNFVCGPDFAAKKPASLDPNGWGSQGQEAHGINGGNPRFLSTAILDFRLAPGGLLIDAGTALSGFAVDVLRLPRNVGGKWDIGPYEYQDSTRPAAPTNLRVVNPG